jgi:diadenylate cyclase
MIEQLFDLLHLHDFGLRAAIEVLILAFFVYHLLLLIKGTRAVQMLYGVLGLLFVSWLTGPQALGMNTIHRILIEALVYIPFVVIVVFQNTIRRVLTGFGANPLGRYLAAGVGGNPAAIEPVVAAAFALAGRRLGGLVVFEREQGLRNWTDAAVRLDALPSFDLIVSLFSPGTPLHDGAVVIGDGRLRSASCFLPLTNNPSFSSQYGTRHRAAVGISEETDAVAVVISEERGTVAVALDGALHDRLRPDELRHLLVAALDPALRRPKSPKGSPEVESRLTGAARGPEKESLS